MQRRESRTTLGDSYRVAEMLNSLPLWPEESACMAKRIYRSFPAAIAYYRDVVY